MNDLGWVAEGENLFPTQYTFALLEITHQIADRYFPLGKA